MRSSISVVLVDDHALVRDVLADRLRCEPGITVAGVAATADEAIEQCITHQPDIVSLDIDMPDMIGTDAARIIAVRCPDTRIIFLSAYCHDQYIAEALAAGASGYITKGESFETVVKVFHIVAAGDAYFSPEVQERIVVDARGAKLAPKVLTRASTLTARESQILRYIARGMSKKEIAAMLRLSVNTVDVHTSNVMTKLDIHDRVHLTRFAIREGLAEA